MYQGRKSFQNLMGYNILNPVRHKGQKYDFIKLISVEGFKKKSLSKSYTNTKGFPLKRQQKIGFKK